MKVCEACYGRGCHERTYHGLRVTVMCGTCLGVGSLLLGHETFARWQQLREAAIATAIREGWHEVVYEGEPGQARPVLRLVGPSPEFVRAS